MRVLGVDPGLTRCGLGVVEGDLGKTLALVHVEVIKTSPQLQLSERLLLVSESVKRVLRATDPDVVAVEAMFSQNNLHSVMGTAQSAAVSVLAAAELGIPVRWHTPTEVKAAVTGSGRAQKAQVASMVCRILRLPTAPKPVDATDALALAICQVWKGRASDRIAAAVAATSSARIPTGARRAKALGTSGGRSGGPGTDVRPSNWAVRS